MKNWVRAAVLAAAMLSPAAADEGMWLFSHPPRQQVQARYGFELTKPWLEHLMHASVRFNNGGSGSFVSPEGLVITNHHVASDALQKLSSAQHNYLRDGFHARTRDQELRCLDLELNVLQSIEDVTARVTKAVEAVPASDAASARRRVQAEIEQESLTATGLRSDVVTLYQGGAYHLYRYKRYTDVRLVFAPEQAAAFFGGDPDNFEFPRYNLDICFFRVYEEGKPVQPDRHFAWSTSGPQPEELVFVSGHPGRTSRLLTTDELADLRDEQYPAQLAMLKRREVLLKAWSARDLENARRARDDLLTLENARKVRDGGLAALLDPQFFGQKVAEEQALKQQLANHAEGPAALAAFAQIAEAQRKLGELSRAHRYLEGGQAFNSQAFRFARQLLRAGDETSKPSGERLREYADARRATLELALLSERPIYEDLEIVTLGDSLTDFAETFGGAHPLVRAVLNGKSPRARAAELITTSKVRDPVFRRQVYEGGASAVRAAQDPLIELARLVDPEARKLRELVEAQTEVKQQAHAALGRARFALHGTNQFPDATFTLRLSYGQVKGYVENGQYIPPFTFLGGLFARNAAQQNREPFDLPELWLEKRGALNPHVPYNFVSTVESIGGNSGSPVLNRAAEFVGIVFDGNIHSLVGDFGYDEERSRTISVHSAGILETLRKIYGAEELIQELLRRR